MDGSRWHLAWRWASVQATLCCMGTQHPSIKGGRVPPPNFCPISVWPNGCMYQNTTWYGGRLQPRQHCVRWGPSSPSSKGAQPPQFLANVRCSQMAGWTKMPLGIKVGLGPGGFVFDGDSAPPKEKGHSSHPIFGPYLLWPTGWMDEDATWYGNRPRPGHIVLHGTQLSPSPAKGAQQPPSFWPMSVVATVARLSYC